jgi:hypothetical protein
MEIQVWPPRCPVGGPWGPQGHQNGVPGYPNAPPGGQNGPSRQSKCTGLRAHSGLDPIGPRDVPSSVPWDHRITKMVPQGFQMHSQVATTARNGGSTFPGPVSSSNGCRTSRHRIPVQFLIPNRKENNPGPASHQCC